MTATTKITIAIQKTLFDQLEGLRQQFNLSLDHLVELAIENLLRNYPNQALLDEIHQRAEERPAPIEAVRSAKTTPLRGRERAAVNQGDIFWIPLEELDEAESDYHHPHVVIQDNVLNRSRINTVVVCALTSNLKRAKAAGHVLLEDGEANLPRQSVVVVSQVATVDKTQLGEYIGTLTEQRINQILAGMRFLQTMTAPHAPGEEK